MCFDKNFKLGFSFFCCCLFFFTFPFNNNFRCSESVCLWDGSVTGAVTMRPCRRHHLTLRLNLFCSCSSFLDHIHESLSHFYEVHGAGWGEAEKRGGEAKKKKRGHGWECDHGVLSNKSSGLHRSLFPRRSFVLKMLSLLFLSLRLSLLSSLLS